MDLRKMSLLLAAAGLAVFFFGAGMYYDNRPDRIDIGIGTLDMRDAFNPQRIDSRKKGQRLMLAGAAGAVVGVVMFVSAKKR